MFPSRTFYRKLFVYYPLFTFVLTVMFTQCRKQEFSREDNDQQIVEKFLRVEPTAEPLLIEISNDLRQKNSIYNNIVQIAKEQGYPAWNKVMQDASANNVISSSTTTSNSSSTSSTTLFIPLIKDSLNKKAVNAILIARQKNDSLQYRLIKKGEYEHLRNNRYSNAPSSEAVVSLFMSLERNVYGHQSFRITNKNLFPDIKKKVAAKGGDTSKPIFGTFEKLLTQNKGTTNGFIQIEICEIGWASGGWLTGCPPGADCSTLIQVKGNCYSQTIWLSDGGSGTGGTGGGSCDPVLGCPSGDGGVGNGGGGDACVGCNNGYTTEQSLRLQALKTFLSLTPAQAEWIANGTAALQANDQYFTDHLYEWCMESEFSFEASVAGKIIVNLTMNNLIQGPYNDTYKNIIAAHLPTGIVQAPNFNEIVTTRLPSFLNFIKQNNNNPSILNANFGTFKKWIKFGDFNSLKSIEDDLTSPCLKNALSLVKNANLDNYITKILQSTFNVGDRMNVTFHQAPGNEFAVGEAASTTQSRYTINGKVEYVMHIKLNETMLSHASKEFIAETMFHEILHAYCNANTQLLNGADQHQHMINNNVKDQILALLEIFPSLGSDATALVLAGYGELRSTVTGGEQLFQSVLQSNNLTEVQVYDVNRDYKNRSKGTACL